jgi:hypothetical protein
MKTPALLLGTALVFWGWQTGLWLLAIPMALIFEASRQIRLRWDLSAKDFRRITDGCTLLFIFLVVYLLLSHRSAFFIVALIQYLPVVFFPLLAAQAYSTSDRVDIRALFLLLRRKQKNEKTGRTLLNLSFPYFAVCIVSASAANIRDSSFYVGLLLLVALALWRVRARRFSSLLWIGILALAGAGGVLGHIGLHHLQLFLEAKGLEWTSDFRQHDPDPFQTHTAIGDIGSLKPSDRIIFRVTPQDQKASPMLLRETTYNRYLSPIWVAVTPDFTAVWPDVEETTWHFYPEPDGGHSITVAANLHKGKGVLKLPDGAFRVDNLPVVSMQRNQYGTVKVEGGPGFVTYRIQFDRRVVGQSPPAEYDLSIPQKEKAVVEFIRDRLQLTGKTPQEILARVENFFLKNFSYSLVQHGGGNKKTPWRIFYYKTVPDTANILQPPPFWYCVRPASRPATPGDTRCMSSAVWRIVLLCAIAMRMPGRWSTSTTPGSISIQRRAPGLVLKMPLLRAGSSSPTWDPGAGSISHKDSSGPGIAMDLNF